MLTTQVCKGFEKQIAALFQASRDLQGIGLAAKTYNWPGLHKVAMSMSHDADKEEHSAIKYIRDYGDDLLDLPQCRSASCEWKIYPEMWKQVQAIAVATQQAWNELSKMSEDAGDMDAAEYIDKRLKSGVTDILHLNRWIHYLDQADKDVAAWRVFDNKRR